MKQQPRTYVFHIATQNTSHDSWADVNPEIGLLGAGVKRLDWWKRLIMPR